MRQVNLDSKLFRISGEIQRRNINPWTAKIGSGGLEYSDFSQANLKEWHDFRGGMGLESELPSEAGRFYWSEGVNTSIEKCLILGPKITTAGTFAKACTTIFDFNGSGTAMTYAAGDNLIAEWKGDADWTDAHAYSLANYVNPTTDNGHCYECTTAGTSGGTEPPWPTTNGGTVSDGTDPTAVVWTCRAERWVSRETGLDDPIDSIVVTDTTDSYAVVSSTGAAKYSTNGTTWTTLTGCKGYLAVLDGRLCGFYGNTLNYSPKDSVLGSWATFNLPGDFGTIHKLFAGKLLSNGDPVLYLVSNKGLWAIDFWTQNIYKQEISYPPHDDAGHCGMYWNSYVWVATGAGIKKISPGMASDVGPDQDDGLPSGYQGFVSDMEGASDWLVYCVDGNTTNKSTVFKRHSTVGGNHQIYTSESGKRIRCLHISPSSMYSRGRLWWGEDTGIKYCEFPDFNANPTEMTDYEYILTSGKLILPTFRSLAVINKLALRVQAVTHNCDTCQKLTGTVSGAFTDGETVTGGTSKATGTLTYGPAGSTYILLNAVTGTFATGETATGGTSHETFSNITIVADADKYITVYYKLDKADWADLGTFKSSPLPTELEFTTGAGTEFRTIQFGVDIRTNLATSTPELESLMFTWLARPKRLRGWSFTIIASQHDAEQIVTDLHAIQDKNTLVTFYPSGNTNDTSYKVALTDLPENIHWDAGGKQGEIRVSVQEVFRG